MSNYYITQIEKQGQFSGPANVPASITYATFYKDNGTCIVKTDVELPLEKYVGNDIDIMFPSGPAKMPWELEVINGGN